MTEEFTMKDPGKENSEMFMLAHNHVITYKEFFEMSKAFEDSKVMITLPRPITSLNGNGNTYNNITVMKIKGQFYSVFSHMNQEDGTIRFDIPDTLVQLMLQEKAVEDVKERFAEKEKSDEQ